MKELVFFLEEPSARAMLIGVLPNLGIELPSIRHVVFEGKQDLEKNIVRKIRAYQNPDARFIVIRDQDSSPDCKNLKKRLLSLCKEAGRPNTIVRIFCHELETIYLADLTAVEKGLGVIGISRHQEKSKYRNPDLIASPSFELKQMTNGKYQKVSGSRAISPFLDITNSRSASFVALILAVRRACNSDD